MQRTIIKKPFYFVRHGETDWNRKRIFQGSSEVPLNETGLAQASFIATILKQEPIAHIVSSPLARAKNTAEIISEQIQKPIDIIDELAELSLGEKEGTPVGNGSMFDHWLAGVTPPGGESTADFHDRVFRGLMKGLSCPSPTLIVAHGGVFMAMRRILNLPPDHIQNCQVIYHEPTMHKDTPWTSSVITDADHNEINP